MVSRIVRLILMAGIFLYGNVVFAACDDGLPEQGSRDDILIVVNDNSLDSCEVGRYYAEQRGLGRSNIVHVSAPASYWLTWDEFRSMRDQIIRYMQFNTFKDATAVPAVCQDGDMPYYCAVSMEQMQQQTKIRYIVMTRGVPTRHTVDNSPLSSRNPSESTSVDNYLAYWLIRYFAQDTTLSFLERERAFGDGRGMRIVEPSHDKELIIGRLDGIDLASTKSLIDRTMNAEQGGIYGKNYGSKFGTYSGRAQWKDYVTNRLVYGTKSYGADMDSWRYQLGIFGEDRPECIDYLNYGRTTAAGKAPSHCQVRISDSQPGTSASRTPIAEDALIYLGQLHGQISGAGNFNNILNWVKNDTCTIKLCENAADPAACRAQSTDPLKDINTQCVGVADGFMGYNYQSFPVSYMASWPTGWRGPGGGSNNNMAFPKVRDDIGQDDSHSLWFRNTDAVANALCYPLGADLSLPPAVPCRQQHRVALYQTYRDGTQTVDLVTPQTYRVGLWMKTETITLANGLYVQLQIRQSDNSWVRYPNRKFGNIAVGTSDWTYVETDIQLDPVLHTDPSQSFHTVQVYLNSGSFTGDLGIDNVNISELNSATTLVRNPSFTEGHKEVSGGDHASMYLSRLNGVAFWGSTSHHQSGGHSFPRHPMETILYFFRGLPLGDAVWWAEDKNSGILYGDPVYSPVAVRFDYLNDADLVYGTINLSGSTVNGRDTSKVGTSYSVEYCPGNDFFLCDQARSWQSTGLAGVGGRENMPLGSLDTRAMPQGEHTLRLTISSQNYASGKQQNYYDFYPLTIVHLDADDDDDGLSNGDELNTYGTDYTNPDSDGDGLTDGEEVLQYHTDPLSSVDTDRDGMSDDWERVRGTDPAVDDATADTDGDGVENIIEHLRGTLPGDATSTPVLTTIYLDAANTTGVEDGSLLNPFSKIRAALMQANHGDTIRIASGMYEQGGYFNIAKSVNLVGPSDRSAIFTPFYSAISGVKRSKISGISLGGYFWFSASRNVEIENSTFFTNTNNISNGSKVKISNSTRYAATASSNRIGINTSEVELNHVTITGFATGLAVQDPFSSLKVQNSILVNTVDITGNMTNVSVSYSLVSDGQFASGPGNISADPVFFDAVNYDYHLAAGSPAIDAGDPDAPYYHELEPNGCRVNMGAFGNTAEATAASDPDADYLFGYCEQRHGADPAHPDTDGDTIMDGIEVLDGTDPASIFSPNKQGIHISNEAGLRQSTIHFATTDVMHMMAWSSLLDAADIKFARYALKDGSTVLASGDLSNAGNGRFTATVDLSTILHVGNVVVSVHIQQNGAGDKLHDSRTVSLGTGPVTDVMAPAIPLSLIATSGNSKITLEWQASTDDTGVLAYDIKRSDARGTAIISVDSSVLKYVDADVVTGVVSTYRVRARDASGKLSAWSEAASATAR